MVNKNPPDFRRLTLPQKDGAFVDELLVGYIKVEREIKKDK